MTRLTTSILVSVALTGTVTATTSVWSASPHHIHVASSSAVEATKWYQQYLECTAVADQPKAVDCQGMRIIFTERPSIGGSQGTGINHISFSYADVVAKMSELESIGVRGSGVRLQRFEDGSTVENLPGLFKHAFVFDPWGARIELIEDQELIGFHHVHLQSTDPAAAQEWYADNIGGERSVFGEGSAHERAAIKFERMWLLFDQYAEGQPAPTDERSIDHIGFSADNLAGLASSLADAGVNIQEPNKPEGARTEAQRAYVSAPDGVLLALVEPEWAGVVAAVSTTAEPQTLDTDYVAAMTPWGTPDLQGIWTANAAHGIPLERPEDASDENLTEAEAAARRERGTLGSIWGYEREWRDTTLGYDKNAPSRRLAMIIDPLDGRMPAMTEKGKSFQTALAESRAYPKLAGGPEDLTNYVRCITRGLPSMMMPSIYNNGLQIVQSPGYVAIQKEMIHETRIIPTSAKPHLSDDLQQWLGNSRGYWDGDTLVVEVRGFSGEATYQGAGAELKLTERFRRVSDTKLEYQFTVEDPTVWAAPWTGMFNFDKDDEQYELVEYACHEGNYGMFNILSGARAKERQSADPAGGE
ncbi:MAG: catechol 2,3-dioxygenase-like lactoylglutathione lyase family enzyme [Limisphaerales bacterium]|jgi:catechol 2,3-dioxygenase-like lactoylglutathione lyase family enzyme